MCNVYVELFSILFCANHRAASVANQRTGLVYMNTQARRDFQFLDWFLHPLFVGDVMDLAKLNGKVQRTVADNRMVLMYKIYLND
jgi:hypothetical protein